MARQVHSLRSQQYILIAEGTEPTTIAQQLADFDGYAIVGLIEFDRSHAKHYIEACGVGEIGGLPCEARAQGNSNGWIPGQNSAHSRSATIGRTVTDTAIPPASLIRCA
jgi:hypothetical protein